MLNCREWGARPDSILIHALSVNVNRPYTISITNLYPVCLNCACKVSKGLNRRGWSIFDAEVLRTGLKFWNSWPVMAISDNNWSYPHQTSLMQSVFRLYNALASLICWNVAVTFRCWIGLSIWSRWLLNVRSKFFTKIVCEHIRFWYFRWAKGFEYFKWVSVSGEDF